MLVASSTNPVAAATGFSQNFTDRTRRIARIKLLPSTKLLLSGKGAQTGMGHGRLLEQPPGLLTEARINLVSKASKELHAPRSHAGINENPYG